jgi:transglutaminase-like putative cysteine protease
MPMLARFLQSLWMFSILLANVANGQLTEAPIDSYRKYGKTVVTNYRVGASIEAKRGGVRDIIAMVAVPFECDEQEVLITDEDISPEVDKVEYRILDGGARQMLIRIPELPNGVEAHAYLTFEVRTKAIEPLDEELAAQLVKPKKLDRDMKRYVGRSPYVQSNHGKIRRTLKEIFNPKAESKPKDEKEEIKLTAGEENNDDDVTQSYKPAEELTAWERVEKIYDFVQGHIEYLEGEDQSAVDVLESGKGDCHDVSALFVALCRADKIPARMVWVDQHQYPEFCLADAEGNLHWFPCESSGMRAFGEMPNPRVIMQKGENFRVPERPGEALRYASDYFIGRPLDGGGKPRVLFKREKLDSESP